MIYRCHLISWSETSCIIEVDVLINMISIIMSHLLFSQGYSIWDTSMRRKQNMKIWNGGHMGKKHGGGGPRKKYIVACQRCGVSSKPTLSSSQRQDTNRTFDCHLGVTFLCLNIAINFVNSPVIWGWPTGNIPRGRLKWHHLSLTKSLHVIYKTGLAHSALSCCWMIKGSRVL